MCILKLVWDTILLKLYLEIINPINLRGDFCEKVYWKIYICVIYSFNDYACYNAKYFWYGVIERSLNWL